MTGKVNGAAALTITAAAALLIVAAWNRGAIAQALGAEPDAGNDNAAPDLIDELNAAMANTRNAIAPTPAAGLAPSQALRESLQRREALRLRRYRLGDGGWTIGWGRYFPDGGQLPPEQIDRATADAWFDEDVEERGARWVRAYVTAPIVQAQFDALVSMAFNLRPSSFKTIADAVNRGEDPESAALRFVRAGTNLERGLRNRRADELAMFREGIYA